MSIIRLAGLAVVLVIALLFAVFVGDQGPWYFAWVVGTVMIILIAGAGAILLDAQDEHATGKDN
ncbi:MAG: hypothetical protein ABF990_09805 [Acetobacter sp.]|uniref:hypothetical protein n=1 Tax=Acetobacter sp. TaxID=440 RepID=UPI0039EC29AE